MQNKSANDPAAVTAALSGVKPMIMDDFIRKLFDQARAAGFTVAEAYLTENESFSAVAMNQEITQYSSHVYQLE